jgi:DNA-binding response OmpR family regulator
MSKEMKALVIDDEPQVREFVSTVLRAEGWNVSEVDAAERAFEMLHENQWSLRSTPIALCASSR